MALLDRKLLEKFTGQSDLLQVLKLDIVVDTSEQSLTSLSDLMPNLAFLNISYSRIGELSSLGSFQNLQVLLMDSCQISSLDGLFLLPALERLSLRDNRISDLSPLLDCAGIWYLDISRNSVELPDLQFLTHLPLRCLVLEGNPCDCAEGRELILRALPDAQLNLADYGLLKQSQRNSATAPINGSFFEEGEERTKTIVPGTQGLVSTAYSWWLHWESLSRGGVE